jgi:hypothetical protein
MSEEEKSLEDYELEEVEENYPVIEEMEQIPDITSEQWSDYVIRQLRDDELSEGNPTADGLRRVAQVLLGKIVYSVSRTVNSPTVQNGFHATVEHKVKIRLNDTEEIITFGDVADVHPGNTKEKYAIHAAASAATKAEGRALKKALCLRKILTAEEVSHTEEETPEGKITNGQIWTLNMLASRLDVNLRAFMNAGSQKYENVTDIDSEVAYKMIQKLSDWQNDRSKIKPELKGYDKNWRN